MKKILLTTAAAAVLATSSAYAVEDTFFVKANAGWSKLSKIDGVKSENAAYFGIGAGYHVMDNVRVDLTFDHFVNPTHKGGIKVDGEDFNAKIKGEVNTLMFNSSVDVFDVDLAKIFVGAGIGLSNVSSKTTLTDKVTGESDTEKLKQKYNVAFAGHVGASYELTDGVVGELTYSYRDMGAPKSVKRKYGYKGHHVGAGVRFDI